MGVCSGDGSTSGSSPGIGLGVLALVLWIFWPGCGLWSRWEHYRHMTTRVYLEDALKHIYEATATHPAATLQNLADALETSPTQAAEIVEKLRQQELVSGENDEFKLTLEGRRYALNVIRAHRLWESRLAEQSGLKESEWHTQAERYEHRLTPEQLNTLAAELGNPIYDPHGDPIPTADGQLVALESPTLADLAPGILARVIHIEDEPESIYAQIIALGLHPGMILQVVSSDEKRIRISCAGEEHVLAPIVAANLSVAPIPMDAPVETTPGRGLNHLKMGEKGRVLHISSACRGPERRRLMDLGVLPGTIITAEMTSPAGDPTAYRVRDALIALRSEQAGLILIEPATEESVMALNSDP